MTTLTVYTDGSAKSNGKAKATGGIGIYCSLFSMSMETREAVKMVLPNFKIEKVTNNISELTAILFTLKKLEEFLSSSKTNVILIKSDSNYSINCLTKWYISWEKNNWLSSKKEPVLNKEIIQEILFNYIKKFPKQIIFKHVRAHRKNPGPNSPEYDDWYGNNEADKLSNIF